jgi:hypothetical protein
MGEKLWWRWLKHPTKLWEKIWKNKYAPSTREEQLIRFNDQIQGSNIWNMAWNNRHANSEACFLGDQKWGTLTVLARLLETTTTFSHS